MRETMTVLWISTEHDKQVKNTQPEVKVCLSFSEFCLLFYVVKPQISSATAEIPHNDSVVFIMNNSIMCLHKNNIKMERFQITYVYMPEITEKAL